MQDADFKVINKKLKVLIADQCLAKPIGSQAELDNTVNSLVESIQTVIEQEVLLTKPCTFMKHWWTKGLTNIRKEKNKLSKLSFHFRGIPDHPIHLEHKAASNKLGKNTDDAKTKHWTEWLEDATTSDIYTANKYINNT